MLVEILWTSVNAVLPIVLLIALGYILRRIGLFHSAFLKTGKDLVFKVLLPCSLFVNIYNIEGFGAIRWDIVIYCVTIILLMYGIGFAVGSLSTRDPLQKGVIWQAAFRSNFAIIGLPLATALGGDEGAAMAAIISAFAIPMFNLCTVSALSYYTGGNGSKRSVGSFLLDVLKNPLTVGVLMGLVALAIRGLQTLAFGGVVFSLKNDTPFLFKVLDNLKSATTPLALLVLGGQCEFSATKGIFKQLAIGTACRIILAPVIAIVGAVLLNTYTNWLPCGNGEYAALIALFGSPVAVSSAIVAASMGNDEQLASQMVVWTSVGSVISIFVIVCIMMAAGLLAI